MLKRLCGCLVVLACIIMFSGAPQCSAEPLFGRPSGSTPSVFYYGWRGLLVGSLAGISAGYIRYADDNNTSAMLNSLAYGALAGTGLGLIAGFADVANGNVYGTGDLVLRDMNTGGGFGLIVGLLWGGINAISRGDSKEVGKGAAWGYLGGLVVGLGVAIVENAQPTAAPTTSVSTRTFTPTIMFFHDSRGDTCPGIGATRRY